MNGGTSCLKRLFKKIEIESEATHLEKVQKVVPRNSRIIPSSSEVVEMGGTLSRRMAGIQAGNKKYPGTRVQTVDGEAGEALGKLEEFEKEKGINLSEYF